jgi:protein-disulfide isomerase
MTSSPTTRRKTRRTQRQQAKRANLILMVVAAFVLIGAGLLVVLSNRSANVAAPAANDRLEVDPVLGNPNAPVTIIEYGAYGCSACRAWHQAGIIEQILAEFPDQVRFVFRDFPVIVPAYDRMAAEIAQCALDQSQAGFWAFHDLLYTVAAPGMSQDELIAFSGQAGLDQEALRNCVSSGRHRETVEYDLNRAMNLGLPGTPSFLVNDARIFNATPDVLRSAVLTALG